MIFIYTLRRARQFAKDYKLTEKRGLNTDLLDNVILQLMQGIELDKKYKDH